jgi:hypothetical protein
MNQHPLIEIKNSTHAPPLSSTLYKQDAKLLEKLHGEPFAFGFRIQT